MSLEAAAPSDEVLFHLFCTGNCQDSFAELFVRYNDLLVGFLTNMLYGRFAIAEDIAQQTWVKAHERHAQFKAGSRFRPWLFSIAAHGAKDFLKMSSRRRSTSLDTMVHTAGEDGEKYDLQDDSAVQPWEAAHESELLEQVSEQSTDLNADDQEALRLVYSEGYSFSEAADLIGIPLGSFKSRIHRALKYLRQNLPAVA